MPRAKRGQDLVSGFTSRCDSRTASVRWHTAPIPRETAAVAGSVRTRSATPRRGHFRVSCVAAGRRRNRQLSQNTSPAVCHVAASCQRSDWSHLQLTSIETGYETGVVALRVVLSSSSARFGDAYSVSDLTSTIPGTGFSEKWWLKIRNSLRRLTGPDGGQSEATLRRTTSMCPPGSLAPPSHRTPCASNHRCN